MRSINVSTLKDVSSLKHGKKYVINTVSKGILLFSYTTEGVQWCQTPRCFKSMEIAGWVLYGSNLFLQHIPQMLDWIKIWVILK